ncbi:hypothetical protein DM02DRAFT_615795 [Periconia macrospinosa]|uniref:Uncharacterized protein n=1 Tax=Periconia macrospinosa TaxID=97972 RepID=A0A2V1DJT3_9PLEO|nr:hypothetical protein DM02DRAFT_615795 [Periconia macrospinosa]
MSADGLNDVYEALESYNWDDDVEFQAGLRAILGNTSSAEQTSELTLRARCYYYSRKHSTNIDFDSYKAYRLARGRPALIPKPPSSTNIADIPNNSAAQQPPASGSILPSPPASDPNEPPAPYPTSFAHIVELVTTGQPIPGIKDIPDTILHGQGSAPAKGRRRKPWEKDGGGEEGQVGVGNDGGDPAAAAA